MNDPDNSNHPQSSYSHDFQQPSEWYNWPNAVASRSQHGQGWQHRAAPPAWQTSWNVPRTTRGLAPNAPLRSDFEQHANDDVFDLNCSAGPRRRPNEQYYAERRGRGSSHTPDAGFTAYGGACLTTNTTSYQSSVASENSHLSTHGVFDCRVERDLDKTRNRDSAFRHPPIDYTRRQIRLVRVLPSEPDELIKCKFALSVVDDRSVRYTALSYTWGDASRDSDLEKIVLHKREFWTRRNLWCFLRQVRDDPALRKRWFWIDALCIDQAETGADGHQEKNHQVNMMGQIYSNAHLVFVWLGEPPSGVQHKFGALQHLLEDQEPIQDKAPIRQALRYLGDSQYWSRIWIIQELVLAKTVRFRIGSSEIRWKDIYNLRSEARLSSPWVVQDLGWSMANILDLRHDWFRGRKLDLRSGISDFRTPNCSDSRDKIYALLGLMELKPCRADYSQSNMGLFVDIVLFACKHDIASEYESLRVYGQSSGTHNSNICLTLETWATSLQLEDLERQRAYRRLTKETGGGNILHVFKSECVEFQWQNLDPSAYQWRQVWRQSK
jgi:hypothetical protein